MSVNVILRAIRAEELYFKQNNIKIEKDLKLDLNPAFSRKVRTSNENGKLHFFTLEVKIESSSDKPKPFDLKASLTGIFEAVISNDEERKDFYLQAEKIIYPYLRSAVTSITGAAFVTPLMLPVISRSLFKEKPTDNIGGNFS